jgi:hypothetical protein
LNISVKVLDVIAKERKHARSIALEEAAKVKAGPEAKPVTPTEASGMTEETQG